MTDLIRILIVDDHLVVRQGLRALLIPRNGMEVVGEAADGAEAVEKARTLQPDLILMDLNMPGKGGLEAIAEIIQDNPEARILVLTSYGEDDKVSAAIEAGALGYLLKNSSGEALFHAVRGVAMGSLSLAPDVAHALRPTVRRSPAPPSPAVPGLTEREVEVLTSLAHGLSNQKIAETLGIEKTTVRSHISTILSKLNLDNRTQAALYAVDMGLSRSGEEF